MDRLYKYANETKSRVPLSDWYFTDSGNYVAFIGRSVVGGHWMKVLLDKCVSGELMTGIKDIENSLTPATSKGEGAYDLSGRKIDSSLFTPHSSLKSGIYIINGKKVVIK